MIPNFTNNIARNTILPSKYISKATQEKSPLKEKALSKPYYAVTRFILSKWFGFHLSTIIEIELYRNGSVYPWLHELVSKSKLWLFTFIFFQYRIHLRITPWWKHLAYYLIPVIGISVSLNIPLFTSLDVSFRNSIALPNCSKKSMK